jgi:cytochrome c biogenesis protein CcmG/thiol:disulfide interchange protein DsbE
MRRIAVFAPILIFGLLVVFFYKGLGMDPAKVPSPLVNKPAPEFALPAVSAAKPGLARADFLGRVTVLNFFASWCVPCRAEHPLLMELARTRPEIDVVAINYKDKPEDALAWLGALGDPYRRIAADHEGRVSIDWGVYGVPESYVIDAQGNIRHKQVGPFTDADMQKLLPLLTELSR